MTQEHGHHAHPDTASTWDDRYRSSTALWSGNPNPQLVAEVSGLAAGHALDVGCGEGADAVWLAERGWQVTAVDISTVALSRAAAHAVERGVDRITWIQADLDAWAPEPAGFDLVSAQFMQLPPERREPLFRRLAGWVAPGGTLLIVGHHPLDLETNAHRPPAPEVFFTAEDAATSLDPHEWRILVSAARPRASADRDGQPVTVHDTVLRAERLQ